MLCEKIKKKKKIKKLKSILTEKEVCFLSFLFLFYLLYRKRIVIAVDRLKFDEVRFLFFAVLDIE